MNFKRFIAGAAMLGMALALVGCGETVKPGETGLLVRSLGSNAGVDKTPLSVGWHATGFGEDIVTYPTRMKTHQFQGEEAIPFSDINGVSGLSGDVNLQIIVQPSMVPTLYLKYNMPFEALLDGPIRNSLKTHIAEESEKLSVDQMTGQGRQIIIANAAQKVEAEWAKEGVIISNVNWIGNLHYPQVMVDAILRRTQADQQVAAAEAQQKVAVAEAATKVAEAQGDADAARIRGAALEASPQVLKQLELQKWKGLCPLDTKTCIIGGDASTLVQADQ